MDKLKPYLQFTSLNKLEGVAKTSLGLIPFRGSFIAYRPWHNLHFIKLRSPCKKTRILWNLCPETPKEIKDFISKQWKKAWRETGPFQQLRQALEKYPGTSSTLWKQKCYGGAVWSLEWAKKNSGRSGYAFILDTNSTRGLYFRVTGWLSPSILSSSDIPLLAESFQALISRTEKVHQQVQEILEKEGFYYMGLVAPVTHADAKDNLGWNISLLKTPKKAKKSWASVMKLQEKIDGTWTASYFQKQDQTSWITDGVEEEASSLRALLNSALPKAAANFKKAYPEEIKMRATREMH
jgi:hypothetical protein